MMMFSIFLENTQDSSSNLLAISNDVGQIEAMLVDFKEHLTQQHKLLKSAEALKDTLKVFQQRNEHIAANLPQHLPSRDSG